MRPALGPSVGARNSRIIILPLVAPRLRARPHVSAHSVPPAAHDGVYLGRFHLFIERYPLAGAQTARQTFHCPRSEWVVPILAQHHGVVSRAVVAPIGRMVGGPLVHPRQTVLRGRPYRMRHDGLPGLDDPQALRAPPETIVGVDIVDEEFLAEGSDSRVRLKRHQ